MDGLVLDIGGSRQAGILGGGCVGGMLLGVFGDLQLLCGVAETDDDVISVKGVVEGIKVCIDLENAIGCVWAVHDFTFVLVDIGDVAGQNLEVMQGCWGLASFAEQTVVSP